MGVSILGRSAPVRPPRQGGPREPLGKIASKVSDSCLGAVGENHAKCQRSEKHPGTEFPQNDLDNGSELSGRDWWREVEGSSWGRLQRLWGVTPGRPGRCRRKRVSRTVQVQLTPEGGVALQGVETCGSVWSCPVCSGAICSCRAAQVKALAESWGAQRMVMVTLTIRHHRQERLAPMAAGIAEAWQDLWRGRAAIETKERWGIGPWVRAVEVTHGVHGWHPHLHVALGLLATLSDRDRSDLQTSWAERWEAAVVRRIGERAMPEREWGVHVDQLRESTYLAKLGLELAGARKEARRSGNDHPSDLAWRASYGDPMATMLWREYCGATKGRRQLTWSRGAKHLARRDAELAQTDETGVVLAEFDKNAWDSLVRTPAGLAAVMRTARDSVG